MNRALLPLAAILVPALAFASARIGGSAEPLGFELQLKVDASNLQLTLHSGSDGHNTNSSTVGAAELDGLDVARMREGLGKLGITRDALPRLAAEAAQQWTATFNPRPITAEDFEELYVEALGL